MEVAGVVLGAIGAFALVVMIALEWLKRPRLEVMAETWKPSGPTAWWFAVAHVRNKPLSLLLRGWLVRQSATGCEITLQFRDAAQSVPTLPDVAARWSANREPITLAPQPPSTPGGQVTYVAAYDPTLVPDTRRFDVPPSGIGQEVAVAIIRADNNAFIFGAESYAHPMFGNPQWQLGRQIYDVEVIAESSGIRAVGRFRLDNRAASYASFRLTRRDS